MCECLFSKVHKYTRDIGRKSITNSNKIADPTKIRLWRLAIKAKCSPIYTYWVWLNFDSHEFLSPVAYFHSAITLRLRAAIYYLRRLLALDTIQSLENVTNSKCIAAAASIALTSKYIVQIRVCFFLFVWSGIFLFLSKWVSGDTVLLFFITRCDILFCFRTMTHLKWNCHHYDNFVN